MKYNYKTGCTWKVVFFSFFFSLFSVAVVASGPETTSNSKFPFTSGETLHYKLSYRGLLTSMIWAALADVKMTYITDKKTPDQQNAYQFELFLSTENYTKAEMFQPVRYTYTTTLDSLKQRTVLVEEVDDGQNQSHEFLWLDWDRQMTQLFKKREKEQEGVGFWGLDVKEVWEKDGELMIPDFLGSYPLLDDQHTYLIHKESGDKIDRSQVLDPLSLIYSLRSLKFADNLEAGKEVAVAVSDDIRLYHVKKMALEKLSVNGQSYQGTKYKIQTDEKKNNFYYVWLSDDEKKVPLRMAMDAPLGKLEIDLMKVTQE